MREQDASPVSLRGSRTTVFLGYPKRTGETANSPSPCWVLWFCGKGMERSWKIVATQGALQNHRPSGFHSGRGHRADCEAPESRVHRLPPPSNQVLSWPQLGAASSTLCPEQPQPLSYSVKPRPAHRAYPTGLIKGDTKSSRPWPTKRTKKAGSVFQQQRAQKGCPSLWAVGTMNVLP